MGLGLGFILSALFLAFFGGAPKTKEPPLSHTGSPGIEQKAPDTVSTKSDISSNTASKSNTSSNTASKSDTSSSTSKGQATKADTSGTSQQAAWSGESLKTDNPQTVSITITSGMGSESVARQLEEKGAIKDRHEFLKVVDRHNAQRRLQNGTFKVPVGGDLEDILDALIGRKKS